jgi:hypothetical protein
MNASTWSGIPGRAAAMRSARVGSAEARVSGKTITLLVFALDHATVASMKANAAWGSRPTFSTRGRALLVDDDLVQPVGIQEEALALNDAD